MKQECSCVIKGNSKTRNLSSMQIFVIWAEASWELTIMNFDVSYMTACLKYNDPC